MKKGYWLIVALMAHSTVADEAASVGEGFGFPLYGLEKESGKSTTAAKETGLPLLLVSQEDEGRSTRIHNTLGEDGATEEFVTVEYIGEKKFGQDLDEWVNRSRADFQAKLTSWRSIIAQEDAKNNSTSKLRAGRGLNTFGRDDRVALSSALMDRFPQRAVGSIEPVGCTGTMIAKNAFLTNRHCILDSNGKLLYGSSFWSKMNIQLGRSDNQYNYKGYLNRCTWSNTYDWAICRTTSNLGLYTGYIGHRSRSQAYFAFPRKLSMISYSGQFFSKTGRPGAHYGCSSRGSAGSNGIHHDCDGERGSSGSAMLEGEISPWSYTPGGPWVVGVNYAEYRGAGSNSLHLYAYSNSYANLFWHSSTFAAKIADVQKSW